MKRWPVTLLFRMFVLVGLAGGFLFLQVVAFPEIVRRILLDDLSEIGLPGSTMDVRSCSWRGAELVNVRLGTGECGRIGALTVQYSLWSLMHKRLIRIQLIGGRLLLRVRDGTVTMGELTDLGSGTRRTGAALPFGRIDLSACTLALDWEGQRVFMLCNGSIVNSSDQRVDSLLNFNLNGIPFPLQVSTRLAEHISSFSIKKKALDVRACLTALPADVVDLPARLSGNIDVEIEGVISRESGLETLCLRVKNGSLKTAVAGHPLDVDGVTCRFVADSTDPSFPITWRLSLAADAVRYRDFIADGLCLSLKKTVNEFVLQANAAGEKWRLKQLRGLAPCSGEQKASISWQLEGKIPACLAEIASNHGADLSGLGELNISGRAAVAVPPALAGTAWNIDVPELRVGLASGKLKFGEKDFIELSAELLLAANFAAGRLELLPESWVQVDAARIGDLTVEKTRVSLGGGDAEPLVEVDATGAHIRLGGSSDGTMVWTGKKGVFTKFGPFRFFVNTTPGKVPEASGTLELDRMEYHWGASGMVLALDGTSVDGRLISEENDAARLALNLSLSKVTLLDEKSDILCELDERAMPPVAAFYRFKQHAGRFQMQWPLSSNALVRANGSVNFNEKQPVGLLQFACDGIELNKNQPVIKRLSESFGLTVRGGLAVDGKIRFSPAGIAPCIRVSILDAAIGSNRYKSEAAGIDGSITFTGFTPLTTRGNQRISVRRLQLGKLALKDGLIVLRLESDPPALLIERAEWGCLGGRMYSDAWRVDPQKPEMDIRLFANGVDIDALFELAFGEQSAGNGALYGMIPLQISRINWTDFSIGEGFLYSSTSGGSWTLANGEAVTIAQKTLEKQLEKILPETVSAGVRDKIVRALRDFQYDLFKIDFIRQSEGVLARITTGGRSLNQEVPVEFEEIILEFPGFDETLRDLMRVKAAIRSGL